MTADPSITATSTAARALAPPGPRLLLAEHHRALDSACRALLGYTYQDDPRELIQQYRRFERATVDHLAAEEELILPAYADEAPDDAREIYDDHMRIRQLLFRIGVEVELRVVRAETVKRLVATLQAHAAREDAGMYPWAQAHLPLSTRRQLFVRIGRSLRTFARIRPPVASAPASSRAM